MRILICLIAALSLTACSSGTMIRVTDPETRIFVNGEFVGTGKGFYSDRKLAFTVQEVALRKDGCEEQLHQFRRAERPHYGAIFSAYFLIVPIGWTAQYRGQHSYEFVCSGSAEQTPESGSAEPVADTLVTSL